MRWSAEAKYRLHLSRWMERYAYIDYQGALHNAMNALKSGNTDVAALFSQQARAFAEGRHKNTLERLERLDQRIAAAAGDSRPESVLGFEAQG